ERSRQRRWDSCLSLQECANKASMLCPSFPAARCQFFILVLVADSCCCRGVRVWLGGGGWGSPQHLAAADRTTVTIGPGQLDTNSYQNRDPGGLIWCLPSVAR